MCASTEFTLSSAEGLSNHASTEFILSFAEGLSNHASTEFILGFAEGLTTDTGISTASKRYFDRYVFRNDYRNI